MKATITVKNTGNYNGYETIQVYIKNLDAPFRVPRHELIYFKKVWIPKGSQKKIAFEISTNSFENVDENGDRKITSGRYEIYVGGGQPTYTKTQNAIIKMDWI